MDFRRLEAFCKVYELKSFSKAGEALFLSQPTISAHIASLEKDMMVKLFDRMGRSILPTAAADILYQHARAAFSSIETAKAEIKLLQDRVSGALAIGGSTIPAHWLLPEVLAAFIRRYPDVKLHVHVGDSKEISDLVLSGELMVGVVGAQEDNPELLYTPILKDELVIIASPQDSGTMDISRGVSVSIADLLKLKWVMREPGSGTRHAFESGLAEQGIDARQLSTSIVVESTQAVLHCVKAGLGVSITSRLVAAEDIERGALTIVKCPELSMPRNFYSVYQRRRYMFPAVRYFIEFLGRHTKGTGLDSAA